MTEQEIDYSNLLQKFDNIKTADCVKIISSIHENNVDKVTCILAIGKILVFKTIDEKKLKIVKSIENLKNMQIIDVEDLNKLIDDAIKKKKNESDLLQDVGDDLNKDLKLDVASDTPDTTGIASDTADTTGNLTIIDHSDINLYDTCFIGEETLIREKKEYEKTYSYDLQKNSITEQLINLNIYNKISIHEKEFILEKKAEKILDHSLRSKINFSYKKPLIENFINNDFSDFIIKPLVKDVKKIHMEKQNILELDKIDKTRFPDLYFSNYDDEIKALEQHSKEYHDGEITKNNYDKNNNYLYTQKSDGIEQDFFYLNRPYFQDKLDLTEHGSEKPKNMISYYISKPLENNQVIYRSCLKFPASMRCNTLLKKSDFNIEKNNYLQSRIADGNIYTLKDNFTNRIITDRKTKLSSIITCSGSGNTTELFYSTTKNKKDYNISEYNKSIVIPPSKILHTEGEILNISGILIKSINDFQPQFINNYSINNETNVKIESHGSNNIIKFNQNKNIGYNLVDQININQFNINYTNDKSLLKNYTMYQNINNANFLDYSKNNFVYFDTNIENIKDIQFNKKKLTYYLNKIIPNPIDIFKFIEPNIKECENFNEFDKILSKYDLSIYNFNKKQIQSINIKILLQNTISKHNRYFKHLKFQKKYFKNNNEKAKSLLNLIIRNKKLIEKNDIYSNILINEKEYLKNLINKIFYKVKETFKEIYTYNDLLNIYKDYFKQDIIIDNDYENILIIIIEHVILKYKYNIEYYNNLLYKNIINYKDNISYEQHSLINNIFKIYNIDNYNSLFLNNFINKNNLSYNDLTIINLIFNLKKSFDNGKLIYEFISYLNKLNNLNVIKNQLSVLSKQNYLNNTQVDIVQWEKLNETDKNKYRIDETLINEKTKQYKILINNFNSQKTIYNFLHTKCENYEIGKVYKNYDHIINDNKISNNLYYDSIFDTTKSDIKDVKIYFNIDDSIHISTLSDDKLTELLIYKYIFNSDTEIKKKIKNIKENFYKEVKDQKRKIENNDFALLYTATERILYKYIKNTWIPLDKKDIINQQGCTLNKEFLKYIFEHNFDELYNQNIDEVPQEQKQGQKQEQEQEQDLKQQQGQKQEQEQEQEQKQDQKQESKIEQEPEQILKKLGLNITDIDLNIHSNYNIYPNNISIPKKFLSFIYKANKLKSEISLFKNTLLAENILTENIHEIKSYIDNEIYNRNKIIENKKYIKNNTFKKKNNDNTNKLPYKYLKIWKDALYITDTDIRLETIKKIIETYGTLKTQSSSNIKINKNFFYWDLPLVDEKMCCVHYYDVVDIAWKKNNIREKILENIKMKYCTNTSDEFKGGIINNRYICNYCGETIDYITLSDFEGFVGEKTLKFREKNNEFNEIEYVEYDDFEKQEILNVLNQYTRTIRLKLKNEDIEFIVKNSNIVIKKFYQSLNDYIESDNNEEFMRKMKLEFNNFDYDYFKKDFGNIDIDFIDKNISKIGPLQQILSREGKKKKKSIHQLKKWDDSIKDLTEQQFNSLWFCLYLKSDIIPNYKFYLSSINLSIILVYLLNIIFYSIPKYDVKGIGMEKLAKIRFFGFDSKNPELSIDYLLNITNEFIKKTVISQNKGITEKDKFKLICWETLRERISRNPKVFDQFKTNGWDIVYKNISIQNNIKEMEENFNKYILNKKETLKDISEKENEWTEFKPTLNVNNFNYQDDDIQDIEFYLDEYKDTQKLFQKAKDTKKASETDLYTIRLSKIKKTIIDLSIQYSEKLILLLNHKINDNQDTSNNNYLSNCCPNKIHNNYIDFFKSDDTIDKLLNNIQSANKFLYNSNTVTDSNIEFTKYNLNSDGTNYRNLLDYMNINSNTTIFENKLFPDSNDYLLYLKKQLETINLTIITEYTTDNQNLFGKKRIWKDIKEYDVYIINDIYNEFATKLLDEIPSYSNIIDIIIKKLNEKYPLIKDQDYIKKRAEMIYDVYKNSNTEEFGLVKLDIISNQYDFQIKDIIKQEIKDKKIDDLKEIIQKFNTESNTKNILKNKYIIDHEKINNFYENQLEYAAKIQYYINNLYNITHPDYTNNLRTLVQNYKITNNIEDFKKNVSDLNDEFFYNFNLENDKIDIFKDDTKYFNLINHISSEILKYSNKKKSGILFEHIRHTINNLGNQEDIKNSSINFIENRLIIENYSLDIKSIELEFRIKQLNYKHNSYRIEIYNKYSRLIINILHILYYQINKHFLNKNIGSNVKIMINDKSTECKIIGINSLKNNLQNVQTYKIKTYDGIIYKSIPENSISFEHMYTELNSNTDNETLMHLLKTSKIKKKINIKKKNINEINKVTNNKPWWMEEDYIKVDLNKDCPTSINILDSEPNDKEMNNKNLKEIYNYYRSIDDIIRNLYSIKTESDQPEIFNSNIVEFMCIIEHYIEKSEDIINLLNLLVPNQNDDISSLEQVSLCNNEHIFLISQYIFYKLLILIFIDLRDDNPVFELIKLELSDIIFNKTIFNLEELLKITDEKIKELLVKEKSKKNKETKLKHSEMEIEKQQVQQLMRAFNLGSKFGAWDNNVNEIDIEDINETILDPLLQSETHENQELENQEPENIEDDIFGIKPLDENNYNHNVNGQHLFDSANDGNTDEHDDDI